MLREGCRWYRNTDHSTCSTLGRLFAAGAIGACLTTALYAETHEYRNGRWFDGTGFVQEARYSADGVFVAERPDAIDRSFDLEGLWIVPPFGEAHNHNVEGSEPQETIARYLAEGIFYVKNPNSLPRSRRAALPFINRPDSIDVAFADGGFTAPDGHPWGLVRRNIERAVWTVEDAEGQFLHSVADLHDLELAWARLMTSRPDFVKTYLLYSGEGKRRESRGVGWHGLDPALLPHVVARAHAAGLRVSTHVETAADFANAIAAGVDEINHLPGFRGAPDGERPDPAAYAIDPELALRAADRDIVVVTTVGSLLRYVAQAPPEVRAAATSMVQANLSILRDAGVRIAIGSDSYEETAAMEVRQLAGLGLFSPVELLRMWSMATPATIFPHRRIGRLTHGYEASFLVLEQDPTQDLSAVSRIRLRVKQGHVLGER